MKRSTCLAPTIVWWILLVFGPPSAFAQEPHRLDVDLSRPNRSVATLPFDEAVRIVGEAPPHVDTIVPLRRASRRLARADCAGARMDTAGTSWGRALPARRTATAGDTFDIILRPLRPDRHYRLCLKTIGVLPDSVMAAVRRRIVARVDTFTQQWPHENGEYRDLTEDDVRVILTFFSEALPPLAPNHQWDRARLGIFGEETADSARVKELFDIRRPIIRRGVEIQNLLGTSDRLFYVLARLGEAQAGPLRRLLDRVRPTDTIAGWPIQSAPGTLDAIRFLLLTTGTGAGDLGSDALRRVSLGLVPAHDSSISTPQDEIAVEAFWSSGEGAAYVERVRGIRQSFEGARSLVSAVALSTRAQFRTGLSQAEANTLRDRLDVVSRELYRLEFDARRLHRHLVEREQAIGNAVEKLSVSATGQVPVVTSTVAVDLNTRAKRYIGSDLGVAYAPRLGEAMPYFGVTFFPWGMNRNVPQRGLQPLHSSFGFMIGVTGTSVAKADERIDLFGNSNILFGGTVRFFDVLRASGGGMALRQLNPGTLSSDAPVRVTPFGSLAFDLDVQALFGGLATILSGGK